MPVDVYVTRPIFDEAMSLLKKETILNVEVNREDRLLSKSELIENLRNKSAVMPLVTDTIDREVLESLPKLRVVSNVAVGYNNVDVNTASKLGILLTNTPGVLTETTADFTWALLLSAARRTIEADAYTRAGKFKTWSFQMFLGTEVSGKTLGIVGFGRIGQAVAQRARGFNMKVVYCNSRPVSQNGPHETGAIPVTLETLLQTSDFISLHVPLVPETNHLLGDRAFAMMKRGAIVINTARGPVIDEKALVRALANGSIAGAALDVFEREPEIEPELLKLDNVVLAPHIASASRETRVRMCMMAAGNLIAAMKDERPPNLVNADAWETRRR